MRCARCEKAGSGAILTNTVNVVAPIFSNGAEIGILTISKIAQVLTFEYKVAVFENATCLNYFNYMNTDNFEHSNGQNYGPTIVVAKSVENHTLIHDKAMEILTKGNPIQFIKETFSEIHIGDEDFGELLLYSIACGHGNNTDGLHISSSGKSGKGKTDACKVMGFLLPSEYYHGGSQSNKALLYMNLKPGSVVLFDDVDSFPDDVERLVKSSTSHYQSGFKHSYVNLKKQGANKIEEVSIPPRTSLWLTSVHASYDTQICNRFVKIDVDESKAHHDQVVDHVLDCAVTGAYTLTVTYSVEVCREMFRILKENQPCSVAIPFAKRIKGNFSDSVRNVKILLDLVKASAILFQFQRDPSKERRINATYDDFFRAQRLWNKIQRAQGTGLTGAEQKVFDEIVRAGIIGITNKELEMKCGMDKGSVWRAINGKKQSGSGEYKGGIRNKVVGLSFDNNLWTYEGHIEGSSGVTLIPEESCSQLHTVAEQCNSKGAA